MSNNDSILFICHSIFKKTNDLFLKKNNIETIEISRAMDYQLKVPLDVYDKYSTIFIILTDALFNEIQSTPKPFLQIPSSPPYPQFDTTENWKNFINDFNIKVKFIFMDDAPESGFLDNNIINFLNASNRCFVISSRLVALTHDRLYSNLMYLPVLYSFYHLNFSNFPKLDYSPPTKPKYDFITYLGQTWKTDKIKDRLNFLQYVLGVAPLNPIALVNPNDLSNVKYKEYDNFVISEQNMGPKEMGHAWNLINSLSGKIQLIFENMSVLTDDVYCNQIKNAYFLTEKIMKLFLLPHPYVVFLPTFAIDALKKYGFKFSYDGNDYKNLLKHIKENIDDWIQKNESDFYHNQTVFYDMVNSIELEHHLILKKIIKNEI
jgi:hypothetical protein